MTKKYAISNGILSYVDSKTKEVVYHCDIIGTIILDFDGTYEDLEEHMQTDEFLDKYAVTLDYMTFTTAAGEPVDREIVESMLEIEWDLEELNEIREVKVIKTTKEITYQNVVVHEVPVHITNSEPNDSDIKEYAIDKTVLDKENTYEFYEESYDAEIM